MLIPEFFSIAKQYFLNCSLTTCNPELTITDNCLVEHCLAPVINLYLYWFLWSLMTHKSQGIQRSTSLHLIPKLLTKTSWCSEIISFSSIIRWNYHVAIMEILNVFTNTRLVQHWFRLTQWKQVPTTEKLNPIIQDFYNSVKPCIKTVYR